MSTTNKFKRIYFPGASSSDVPIGTIIWYTGNDIDKNDIGDKLPGWMICDGSTISKNDYPELARIITSSSGNFKYNKIVGFKLNITRLTKGVESIVFSGSDPNQYDNITPPLPGASAQNYNSYYIPYSTSEYSYFDRVSSNEVASLFVNHIIYKYTSDSERPIRVTDITNIDHSGDTEYYVLQKINDGSVGTKYRRVSIADTVHTGVYMFGDTTTTPSMASGLFENNSVIRDDFEGISLSDFLTNISGSNSGPITYVYNEKYYSVFGIGNYRAKNIDFYYNYESEFAYYKIDIEPIVEYSAGNTGYGYIPYNYFGTYVSDSEAKSYIDSLIFAWNNTNNTEFNDKKPNTSEDDTEFSLPNLMDGTYICGYNNSGANNSFMLGNVLSDSLPAITGEAGAFPLKGGTHYWGNGAFRAHKHSERMVTAGDEGNVNTSFEIDFDASRCNEVYGRESNTDDLKNRVIPKSFVAIPLIKVF